MAFDSAILMGHSHDLEYVLPTVIPWRRFTDSELLLRTVGLIVNRQGLYAARWFLGIAEAGMYLFIVRSLTRLFTDYSLVSVLVFADGSRVLSSIILHSRSATSPV